MPKTLIITEGGKDIGLGHVTRCLSLSQAFEEAHISPAFIINGDRSASNILFGRAAERFNWLDDKKRLFDALKGADIAIIDSYLAGLNVYKEIAGRVKLPVYIDDNARLDYPKGVVVNSAINAASLYGDRIKDEYLLGSEYITLRKEFWDVPGKRINETLKSVLITFGGDDSRNMTPKVLKALTENERGLTKKVILGNGFRNTAEIKRMADEKTEFIYNPDTESMKRELLEADIAVSAGGQTLLELARVGTPAVIVAIAENQLNNVKGWEEKGFIDNAGWWEDSLVLKRVSSGVRKLKEKKTRLKRSATGRCLSDGKGSLRIRDTLLSMAGVEGGS